MPVSKLAYLAVVSKKSARREWNYLQLRKIRREGPRQGRERLQTNASKHTGKCRPVFRRSLVRFQSGIQSFFLVPCYCHVDQFTLHISFPCFKKKYIFIRLCQTFSLKSQHLGPVQTSNLTCAEPNTNLGRPK